MTDKRDAKREVAYGIISTDQISALFKNARKINWPLLGLGTLAGIIGEILRANEPDTTVEGGGNLVNLDDVTRAIKVLERPCHKLNELCREAIAHILCTLKMGKYAKPSPLIRVFKKSKASVEDDEQAADLGTDSFLMRFDAGIEEFQNVDTAELAQFYDEKEIRPTQGLFLILSVKFLLLAVAQEIRSSVVYVDQLRNDGSLTRKRLTFPKMKVVWKALARLFHPHDAEDVAGQGFGSEETDIITKNYTGRTKRNTLLFDHTLSPATDSIETSKQPALTNRFVRGFITALSMCTDFLKSEYSQFGMRAAMATIAGTIPAFLAPSWSFFTEYRGVWITITVILGMSPTTGASIGGLVARSVGTLIGGLLAMAAWYIVVGKVPGVIIFSFIVLFPRMSVLGLLADGRLLLSPAGLFEGSVNSQFIYDVPFDHWLCTRSSPDSICTINSRSPK